jgi:multisubunit Na+/H+ antiporter MnhG subunit
MSYGYEPQDDPQAGTWREVWAIMLAVFAVMGPPLALLLGAVALMVAVIFLLLTNPVLALIPLALIGAGLYFIIRRDRRIQAERETAINEGRPDPYG